MRLFVTRLRPAIVAAALLLPGVLAAQSPRMVLIEEGTNASCGPCADQNPTFEKFLDHPRNRSWIIPVIYHSNWPGKDVMNAANPTMHDTRVGTYYRMSGVPSAFVNGKMPTPSSGWYKGAPGDTAAFGKAARVFAGTTSPITLKVEETRTGKDVSVTVSVTSTEALSGKQLRIVAVEGHHYYASAGYNGEKDFYYIARKMLPGTTGITLDIPAGETRSFTESYTIADDWNANQMFMVAFVQDDATKEVLQAGTNRAMVSMDGQSATSVVQNDNAMISWTEKVETNSPGEYTITYTQKAPAGWTTTLMADGSPIATGAKLTLAKDVEVPISVQLVPTESRARHGEVTVKIAKTDGPTVEKTFRLYADGIQALVLPKDEGKPEIIDRYEQSLERGSVNFATIAAGDEGLFNLNDYDVLIYEVGKNVLSRDDIAQLKSYIDNGGRLFLAGAEIAWGLADPAAKTAGYPSDIPFLENYLHARYASDSSNFTVKGIEGDPIGNGLSFSISDGVRNQDTPDKITPGASAKPILYYGTSADSVAGIRFANSSYRLVYLGFGVEGIGNADARASVLNRSIDWLMSAEITVGVDEDARTARTIMHEARPNPTAGAFELPLELATAAHLTIALYNVHGERVATIADRDFDAGRSTVRFDASELPNGIYTAVAHGAGLATTRTITIVR